MAEPKGARVDRRHRPVEKRQTRRPRRGLAGAGVRPTPAADAQPDPQPAADLPAKFGIAVAGGAAQAMIEMQRHELRPPRRPMRPEQEEQGDRIRPAGQRHRPRATGRRAAARTPGEHGRMQTLARQRRRERSGPDGPSNNSWGCHEYKNSQTLLGARGKTAQASSQYVEFS